MAIHNFGRCDSQLRPLNSQPHSQLLAGKWQEMVISRELHRFCHGFLWGTGWGTEFCTPDKPIPVAWVSWVGGGLVVGFPIYRSEKCAKYGIC